MAAARLHILAFRRNLAAMRRTTNGVAIARSPDGMNYRAYTTRAMLRDSGATACRWPLTGNDKSGHRKRGARPLTTWSVNAGANGVHELNRDVLLQTRAYGLNQFNWPKRLQEHVVSRRIVRQLAQNEGVAGDDEARDTSLGSLVNKLQAGAVRQPAIGKRQIIFPRAEEGFTFRYCGRCVDRVPFVKHHFLDNTADIEIVFNPKDTCHSHGLAFAHHGIKKMARRVLITRDQGTE
jgi:hypothetical protein